MNNNPYRAYWEKSQEQSLQLAQYYTPECLVDLCLQLLQPMGELFDPCCGLGSFLLKAKSKDETLTISGNDIATDLENLSFTFTNSDFLNNSAIGECDYTIANIPFNLKKTHCDLVDENYCWIEKIITNTRKKALIILPSGANGGLNKRIIEKRKAIIESGVLELVITTTPYLFNNVGLSVSLWLINKQKTDKNIYFLDADASDYKSEKYSTWHSKRKILTETNIKAICNKENWIKASLEKIEENNFVLAPQRYEYFEENKPLTDEQKKELDQKIRQTTKELYQTVQEYDDCWIETRKIMKKIDQEPDYLEKYGFALDFKSFIDPKIAEWVLSTAKEGRLKEELARLVNEYYELWGKVNREISEVLAQCI